MSLSRSAAFGLIAILMTSTSALAQTAPLGRVDPLRLSEATRVLASDEFEGRAPVTRGEDRTIEWLTQQFQALGLEPGGPDGSWVQVAQVSRTSQDGPAAISVTANGQTTALQRATDVIVSSDRPVDHISLKDAPLVFVGYGVDAPERGWDDYKGVDLTGKIMLVLVNDPDFGAPQGHPVAGQFGGQAMTFYGRWTYKFQVAAAHGAAGVLVIHDTAGAGYPWSTLQNSSTAPKFDIVRVDPDKERVAAQGWIQGAIAEKLFQDAGLDFAALKAQARTPEFRPVALDGVTMSIDFGQKADRVQTSNILARLPGATHPDETVMFGAHWDAYGRATPKNGDDIYNGAVDNATGVAAVLELARLFAEGPRPERSTVFVSWAAEETGLLGAEYYAANPVWPLETTVANINMDSLLPGTEIDPNIVVIGAGKNDLDDRLAVFAGREGRRLIPDPAPQAGAFYRSDHFPLARKGVPALFAAAGFTGHNAASRDYVANRYHQPTDEWTPEWKTDAAAADVQLLYEVGSALANSRDWPAWKPGDEFEAARNASAAARKP
ncbi:M28 family peptidase [Brevundimonas pondensis]|uniref:M20/M25/M40 family metallo-hydrolase n=1 Tax=Brevundimonas pondensis TaxID=2774189 RepID=A0ABX7SLQ4_9CAUL|nr:M28 family peptidase [Brevundimonas pondensis]QTC87737.1 M20/M25/M40 family metallo-hydrolase [Brevundimonas pondensis]